MAPAAEAIPEDQSADATTFLVNALPCVAITAARAAPPAARIPASRVAAFASARVISSMVICSSWAERAYPRNLIHFNKLDRGGHFAAWEQPGLFAAEMRDSFRTLR